MIQVNDFIQGSYKFGCIAGKVVKVGKNKVVIDKYNQHYDDFAPTGKLVNVTISRIYRVNDPEVNIVEKLDTSKRFSDYKK
jgi:hypothetical protein